MKKLLLCCLCLGLYACDNSNDQKIIQKAKKETTDVLVNLDKKYEKLTLEDRKRNHENRMLAICRSRFASEAISYNSTYKNSVCICFAEKTTEFVASSDKEIQKYNASELYQLKVQEKFFNECAEKNKKYKFVI